MSSTQVLPKPSITGSNGSNISVYDNDNDSDISIGTDDGFGDGSNGPLPSLKTFGTEGSINKMPGSSLLRSVNKTEQASKAFSSNHGSIKSLKSLKSDHTYDFDGKNSGHLTTGYASDDGDEFGEDTDTTTTAAAAAAATTSLEPPPPPQSSSSPKVPAWKLREQARRTTDAPPSQNKFINNKDDKTKRSPVRSVRKTSSSNINHHQQGGGSGASSESSWFQKLTTKKETDEEKEKRLKRESLIEKQDSSRWGKDILEEDSSEEPDDDDGDAIIPKAPTTDGEDSKDDENEEDESDTVKKVNTLIKKSFGSALVSYTKKDTVSPDRPPASAFSSSEEKDGGDDEVEESIIRPATIAERRSSRGSRWAMMGSAAITSVRNMKKGWGEEKDTEPHEDDPITEGDDREKESEKEKHNDGADDVAEALQEKGTGRRRSAMWKNRGAMAFTSVRNAWGGGAASRRRELECSDESSSHADDSLDARSVHSDPGGSNRDSTKESNNNINDNSDGNNLLSSIGNFWEHTRARFDPEVWSDPEIQESVAAIEKLKKKLDDCRNEHRSDTRRRERQIENSIMQQKTFLARKLHRQMYGYKRDPFHSCIKEVYEKEILIIVHEATTLGGDGDDDSQREKDDIDELLDSKKFDFDLKEAETDAKKKGGEGLRGVLSFGRKDKTKGETNSISGDPSLRSEDPSTVKSVAHDSLVPLETKLLRAQHNEWMTDHQMELARGFQQKSVEHLYDILPELRKEHEKIKAIPQEKMDEKIKELEASNNALKEAYQAHVEAQEKLLAIYRERYDPSVYRDDAEEENENKKKEDNKAEGNDNFASSPSTPTRGPQKRPNMWAKKMGQSVRGLFGPKKDESSKDERKAKDDDNSVGNNSDDGGFSLATPISAGSEKKFVLSFGSQAGSIIANFSTPPLDSGDLPPLSTITKASQSLESAKDSAAAAWTFSQMDKASLPETLAEKRAKRAAARKASSDIFAQSETKSQPSNGGTTTPAATSRSELLRRARQARKESAAALGSSSSCIIAAPESPAKSRRSNGLRSKMSSTRKELSMRDLVTSAGDSRRKFKENDSRMGGLTENQDELPLSSPSGDASSHSNGTRSLLSAERLRISRDLRPDDGLSQTSQHSLHERKPRGQSLKNSSPFKEENENDTDDLIGEDSMRELQDVDEFGGEAISSAAR